MSAHMTTVDLWGRDMQAEIGNAAMIVMVSEQGKDKAGGDGGMLYNILMTVPL